VSGILACRSCGSNALQHVLSLGKTPLANALLREEQLGDVEPHFPLEVVFCAECTLVQLTESVPPEQLFSEYLYLSSFADTMVRHASDLVSRMIARLGLGKDSLAIEVASNDGYLLQFYRDAGVPVLGIEPARNIAAIAEEKGIPTLCEFFGEALAQRLVREGRMADVIHANNVLAHVPDLNGVVRGFRALLKPEGLVSVEVPYVVDMLHGTEFDTIYHEHLCYFSLTALDGLFARCGLNVHDVEHLDIHGGSLRVIAELASPAATRTPAVEDMLQREAAAGVGTIDFYRDFATRVETLREQLIALLRELKSQGKTIAAYGASAKGSTLLNFFGIGGDMIDYVVDRSTVKQGMYTPGTRLPIRPPEALVETAPDYVLLLTWNFAREILEQQSEYRTRGGRFIIPIPELQIA
jgi:SAM-dependent methyltransferase